MKAKDLKIVVQDKYSVIADQSRDKNAASCCGSTGCCDNMDYSIFSDDYTKLQGYNADADLGLGCGIPTEFAKITKGEIILDLGSGAGNDCFVARSLTGETGKVVGLDFTDNMLKKANENLTKTGLSNIEFVKGDIENIPLRENEFNLVISNCVLNLVPNKKQAFAEINRVLKSGGRFCISDVVLDGKLPEKLINVAEMYAGCVSGAIQQEDYLKIIDENNFSRVEVCKKKQIEIPQDILANYLNEEELVEFNKSKTGIYSITVTAYK